MQHGRSMLKRQEVMNKQKRASQTQTLHVWHTYLIYLHWGGFGGPCLLLSGKLHQATAEFLALKFGENNASSDLPSSYL